MLTLPNHFNKLLSNIEPPEDRSKAAQEIPSPVREFLKDSEDLKTTHPHTRLGGSYARSTAIGDIRDVDVFTILSTDYQEDDPAAVLRLLRDTLATLSEGVPEISGIEINPGNRRSVHIDFKNADFRLDVVPVIPVDGLDEPLIIPDRTTKEWIKTHPLGYQEYLSSLNAKSGDKVVPLIKMHKHWRDVHMQRRRPKSYWLECLIVNQISGGRVDVENESYAELYFAVLKTIEDEFGPHLEREDAVPRIPDPMLNNNVAKGWDRGELEVYMQRIVESRKWAERALEADRDEAIGLWQRVFGDQFPSDVEEDTKRIAEAVKSGTAVVTSTGAVLTTPPANKPFMPSPPHRFHGEATEEE